MGAYDRDATVHALFARQAELAPHAIAVVQGNGGDDSLDLDDGDIWRYDELEARAGELARLLSQAGVGRGDRVALLCGRSAATIAAMLAVLKCGAAFVPLDPAYPPARLALMLEDAAPVLLLRGKGLSLTSGRGSVRTLELDAALAAASQMPVQPPDLAAKPVSADEAAYVMFTSGSTGRPKGVVVSHRAIVRLVSDQTYARFAPDEAFLHLAPLAFDASTFEIWGALLNGARLVVIPQARPSLDEILDSVIRHQVTVAWFTAGLFHALVDHRVEALASLRRLLAGGDVLSPAHVARIRAALPGCQIVNGYGPTENTTFSCCHVLDAADTGAVPIGACIQHSTAWIADDDLKPAPDGTPGQLVVGGDGLAIGYLNAPELTAQKFVTVPATGERVYLTGDIAVRRPDGVFTFHGRADRQVKIDGKRVELGEIEAALRDCGGVVDAAVICWGPPDTPRRLLAWIIAEQSRVMENASATLAETVRGLVEAALPAHMRPARIAVLDAMPLTDNGKLDRARLEVMAAVDAARNLADALQSAPASDTQAIPAAHAGDAAWMLRNGAEASRLRMIITEAWAEVLAIPAPPAEVSFFDLGGTSLLLMRVQARINAAGAPQLPIVDYFGHPTINSLVARMNDTAVSRTVAAPAGRLEARRAALGRMRVRAGGAMQSGPGGRP